ncbi:MAG: hypothetical protein ACE5I1_06105 [bacterium]
MANNNGYLNMIKTPVLIAIGVAVARFALEAFGAPEVMNLIVGVAWLHMVFPIYFALKILERKHEKPFLELMKVTTYWALPVRAVIAVSYILGYVYQIDSLRFQTKNLGPLGESITPLQGYLLLPLANFVSWMVFALILSAIFGGITLKVKQRSAAQNAA